jgi:acyl dehydratase
MTGSLSWSERVSRAAVVLPRETVYSSWFEVPQRDMDLYMESVHDTDPTHLDPEWTRANTPYPGTIAPGLWVASMLVAMLHDSRLFKEAERVLGVEYALNYGFDRLRFVRPVLVGSRIRGRFEEPRLAVKGENQALFRVRAMVELPEGGGPAVASEWIGAYINPEA